MEERTITVYEFNELGEQAQEKVIYWINSWLDMDLFEEGVAEDLKELFPNSSLELQYSLSHSQGDGVNIYGDLWINDVLALEEIKNQFTEKQLARIQHYTEEFLYKVNLPYNRRYGYCTASSIDFAGELINELEMADYHNIDVELIEDFENAIKVQMMIVCSKFEKMGYEEIDYMHSKEFAAEMCEANEYKFLENGTVFI